MDSWAKATADTQIRKGGSKSDNRRRCLEAFNSLLRQDLRLDTEGEVGFVRQLLAVYVTAGVPDVECVAATGRAFPIAETSPVSPYLARIWREDKYCVPVSGANVDGVPMVSYP